MRRSDHTLYSGSPTTGSERSLASVLFTDIVGSTERASELGDRAWRHLLQRHHALVRGELRRFGGHEISTAGDAFVAWFDNPARAIRCACAVRDGLRALDLEIRSGIHTGEIEGADDAVGGIVLHVGARVAAKARPGEVLVSSTVHDLALGSGIQFESRGTHALRGIPGRWRLFAASSGPSPVARAPSASTPGPTSEASVALEADAAPGGSGRPEKQKAIAVLPFVNLGPGRESEYLSDGITEELIHTLGRVEDLRVVSRTSVFAFKGTRTDVRRIGEQLGVTHVLEGSVRVAGPRLRITAQLVDVASGYDLWSQRYERELEDVFAIEDEISRAISSELQLELLGASPPLVKPGTASWEAYSLYLKGRYFWNRRTRDGLQRALAFFERAIGVDSAYAPAYAGLADTYAQLRGRGYQRPGAVLPRERAAILKALELDDALAEAHSSLGWLKLNYDWDWPGAERELTRAIQLDPGDVNAHHWLSHYWMVMGRADESFAESRRALALAPFDLNINVHLGWHFLHARDYRRAIEQLRQTAEMDPGADMVHLFLGHAHAQLGDSEAALAEYQEHARATGGSADAMAALAYGFAMVGRREDAARVIEKLGRRRVNTVSRAAIHAALDELDRAFAWLERGYERRSAGLLLLSVDPRLDRLRGDPRFDSLLERMGLAP